MSSTFTKPDKSCKIKKSFNNSVKDSLRDLVTFKMLDLKVLVFYLLLQSADAKLDENCVFVHARVRGDGAVSLRRY